MEELRSTDVLDKEIISDARKKAEKILARADETCSELKNSIAARLEEAENHAQKDSSQALNLLKKNIDASLPLEKERYLVSFIHDSVVDAMNEYFEKAGEEKQLLVIKNLLKKYDAVLGLEPVTVKTVGIEKSVAEKILSVIDNPVESVTEVNPVLIENECVKGFKFRKGLLITTIDNRISCRITLDQKVKEILDNNMQELSETLFCGRLPE